MPLSLADAGLLSLSLVVPLVLVLMALPPFMKLLKGSGHTVEDVHKRPPSKVPYPVGPILFLGAIAGEAVAYLTFGTLVPIAVLGAASIAFAIGLADDLFVLGGKAKPLLLLVAGIPLVLGVMFQSDLYEESLTFPLLGSTGEHFIIYTGLAVIAFPVVSNAFNMMDSFNGQISWFTLLTSLALFFGATLQAIYVGDYSPARVASTLPLVAVALGFLVFNRYPSKAFDGDSGSLLMGAMFAALSITSGVEVAAMIAIVPAILNSFYYLSSVRGFVERRRLSTRPTYLGEDGRLFASTEPAAPTTLVRLILLAGPLSEKELVRGVIVLTVIACLLSGLISVMTWVY